MHRDMVSERKVGPLGKEWSRARTRGFMGRRCERGVQRAQERAVSGEEDEEDKALARKSVDSNPRLVNCLREARNRAAGNKVSHSTVASFGN